MIWPTKDVSNVCHSLRSMLKGYSKLSQSFTNSPKPVFLSPDVIAKTKAEVAALGDQVLSEQVFAWVTDAEHNTPRLKGSGRDSFGHWKGELVTTEGWRNLQAMGLAKG